MAFTLVPKGRHEPEKSKLMSSLRDFLKRSKRFLGLTSEAATSWLKCYKVRAIKRKPKRLISSQHSSNRKLAAIHSYCPISDSWIKVRKSVVVLASER
jgi:hypothetical protein